MIIRHTSRMTDEAFTPTHIYQDPHAELDGCKCVITDKPTVSEAKVWIWLKKHNGRYINGTTYKNRLIRIAHTNKEAVMLLSQDDD